MVQRHILHLCCLLVLAAVAPPQTEEEILSRPLNYTKAFKRIYYMNKGKGCSTSKAIRYSLVKAPVQQNCIDCGYYTCRYMMEIVWRGSKKIDPINFSLSGTAKLPYINVEIDEIREQWATIVLPELTPKRR